MKKKFNLINLAIFATAIMSVFTSCGDSEVFDEPVMFRTRAMQESDYIIENSGTNVVVTTYYFVNKFMAEVTFNWERGRPSIETRVSAVCNVTCLDSNFYCITPNPIYPQGGEGYMDGDIPTAHFNFHVKEKSYNGIIGDTLIKDYTYQDEKFTAPAAGLIKIQTDY